MELPSSFGKSNPEVVATIDTSSSERRSDLGAVGQQRSGSVSTNSLHSTLLSDSSADNGTTVYTHGCSFEHYAIALWPCHWHEVEQKLSSGTTQTLFSDFWISERYMPNWVEALYNLSADPEWADFMGGNIDRGPGALGGRWRLMSQVLRRWQVDLVCLRWLIACAQDFAYEATAILESLPSISDLPLFVPGIKLAVALGSMNVLDKINSQHYPFVQLHEQGVSILHHAAYLQNAASIRICLSLVPEAINLEYRNARRAEHGCTPLLTLLHRPRRPEFDISRQLFKPFLEQPDLDLSATDESGQTALHLAVSSWVDRDSTYDLMYRCPAAIYRRDRNGITAIKRSDISALFSGGKDVVNPSIDLEVFGYSTQRLHSAAKSGDIEEMETLLPKYKRMNPEIYLDLLQAFFLTAENQNMGTMQLLLRSTELKVDDQDLDGFTALMVATISGKEYAVFKLRSLGADSFAENSYGLNALFYAIKGRRISTLKALLNNMAQSKVDINHQDSRTGRTVLHYVCCVSFAHDAMAWAKSSREAMLELILTYDPDINIEDNGGKTALDLAVEAKHHDLEDRLRGLGALRSENPSNLPDYTSSSRGGESDAAIYSFFEFTELETLCKQLANEPHDGSESSDDSGSESADPAIPPSTGD